MQCLLLVSKDSNDEHSPINEIPFYTSDNELKRHSRDTQLTNEQGKMILEICKSNSLRILNGRIMGDELGTCTRYPKRKNENPSVIDYTLCGEALLPRMFSFFVLPYTELSDHCCISTHIKVNRSLEREGKTSENGSIKVNPNPPKLKFDKNRVHIFQSNVENSEQLAPLQALVNRPELAKSDIDICI